MKEKFKEINFREDSLERIDQCNSIVRYYQAKNLKLTLRQLFYQLVTKNLVTNEEKSYKKLSSLVSDARLAGLVDWDAIEDRGRTPRAASEFDSLSDLVAAAVASYRLPRWEGQAHYVELWVEKEALAGVLSPISREYHITLMVNKGYSSQSAMYESANRFIHRMREGDADEKTGVLLYLGDHDPSGEDMVRDIGARFSMFNAEVTVTKVALTMAQIRQYNPPPNPAKISDPRAKDYIAKFGNQSWEVDALPPDVLTQLITDEILGLVDLEMMDEVKKREELGKAKLRKAAKGL